MIKMAAVNFEVNIYYIDVKVIRYLPKKFVDSQFIYNRYRHNIMFKYLIKNIYKYKNNHINS